jgi:hypothetical protein
MKGNFHVRFLGEGATVMPLSYPTKWDNQGSESVVVVRVATHQGDGRAVHRAKGLRLGGFNTHRYRGTDSLVRGDNISTINVSETLRHSEYPNCRAGTLDALKGACPVWERLC